MGQVDVSEAKLTELVEMRCESVSVDFKETFDYAARAKQARVRLAKDILAMSNTTGGGYIVLGVRDGDCEPIGLPLDYALDQAILQEKVAPYSNHTLAIHYVQYRLKIGTMDEPKPRVRLFGLIYVEESSEPVISAKEGTVQLENGEQEALFAPGDILVRRGTQTVKANDEEIRQIFEKIRKVDRKRSFEEWRSQVTVLVDELVREGMLVTGTQAELRRGVGEWHNLPRPDFEVFVGRRDYIAEVMDSLTNSRAWIVSIDGVGGVGKTALALYCSYRCWERRDFELIVWISAKSTRLTLSGIDQIVPSLTSMENLLDEIVKLVFPELQSAGKDKKLQEVNYILKNSKALLVVDNLETVSDESVFQFLRDLPTPSKALVTSRNRIGQGERVIRLEGFDLQEALEFMNQEAKLQGATMLLETSFDKKRKLIEQTGGIPLAIKWTVGQIALGRTVAEAIDRLATSGSAPLEFCFRSTYTFLSRPAKALLKSVPLFGNTITREEFLAATELPQNQAEDGLAELVRVSILNTETTDKEVSVYSALPMTRYFAQSLTDRGEQSDMLKRLSKYYEKRKSIEMVKEQAAELFESVGATSERGRTAAMLSQVAFGNYQRGNYDEARKLFEQAIKISPRLSFIYQTWATVEWQQGNYPRARELWEEATRLNPENSLVWRSWGLMEKELGNDQRAEKCLQDAVRVNDNDKVAWHVLGILKSRANNYIEAERCFLKVVNANPKNEQERHQNAVTYHSLAVLLKKTGRIYDAREYCDRGLDLEPNNSRLLGLQKELS